MPTPPASPLAAAARFIGSWLGRGRSYLLGFPKPARLLLVATLVESTGRFMVVPYLSLHLRAEGVGLGTLGLVLGASPVAAVIFGAWGGALADKWGRKPVQALGVWLSGGALIGFAFAGARPWLLALLNFLNGMTRTFYRPATSAALADFCPAERRAEAFALNRVALNAAFGWGPLLGVAAFAWSPRIGFLIGGCLNLAVGLFIVAAVPESLKRPRREPVPGQAAAAAAARRDRRAEARAASRREWRTVLGDRIFWVWILGMTAVVGAYDLIQTFLPLHLADRGVPLWVYGALLSVNALVCVFGQLPVSRLLRRAPIGPIAGLSKIGYALGFLGFVAGRSPAALIAAMLVLSTGEIIGAAVQTRFLPERAPSGLLGRYHGVQTVTELGRSFVAPLAGLAMARWGGGVVFVGAALLSLAGGLALATAGKSHDSAARAAASGVAAGAGAGS
jgi:MFS family permease